MPGSVKGDFNLLQLGALALYVGCSPAEAPIAAAIAAAESGGNPGAQGDIALMDGTWDWSQGLWQIRGLRSERGTGGLRDSLANANPEKNGQRDVHDLERLHATGRRGRPTPAART